MNAAGEEEDTTRRALRRDLGGLVFLETAQQLIALGALLAIAYRALAASEDPSTTLAIVTLVVLALAYLALAFRARLAANLVRRDLWLVEAVDRRSRARVGGHPYRTSAP